ncbi:MAG: SCO family protein [Rhodospirillales bacterium]|nr:SCO family protein [Rhodospirillales bacterium]
MRSAFSQAAIGRTVRDQEFVTALNQRVRLSDYRGRPLIVSLVYTSCADVCPVTSSALADAVVIAEDALGADSFRVVTVGFDARHDTPDRMLAFARRNGLDSDTWQFLSGDGDAIDRLAEDLGFLFYAAPQGFDHMSQTTILDAEGRVFRHVYGAGFEPQQLVEPLKALVFGRQSTLTSWSGLVNQVRLVCTIYDPTSGKYRFDYSIFAMIGGGVLSLGAIAVILVRGAVRGWIRSRQLHRA